MNAEKQEPPLSWSLKNSVEEQSKSPRLGEIIEIYADTDPEKHEYWQAVQRNDVNTVNKILMRKQIKRLQKRLEQKPDDAFRASHLEELQIRLAELEANS